MGNSTIISPSSSTTSSSPENYSQTLPSLNHHKIHTSKKEEGEEEKAQELQGLISLTMENSSSSSSAQLQQQQEESQEIKVNKMIQRDKKGYIILLTINYICLFVGSLSSTLLSKFYFIHKGSSRWVSTWVQCAGFPLLLPFIFLPYYVLRCTKRSPFSDFSPKMILLCALIGLLLGFNNLLFSWGNSYLPVSTSSLLLSSQLVFNLILAVIIVKQKVTFSNLNCVILLTLSSVLLALTSSHDKPNDLTPPQYLLGFLATIGAGLLFALYLPVMERVYKRVYCYQMVVEMQVVMEMAATVLATVGMVFDGGFKEIRVEGRKVFDLGPTVYWMTVGSNVVTWQLAFMGTAGMVYLTTGLTGGVCMTALMAMNVIGGVIVYGDDFDGVKVVSTVLCIWGFCSYVYGIYVDNYSKMQQDIEEGDSNEEQSGELEMIAQTGGV